MNQSARAKLVRRPYVNIKESNLDHAKLSERDLDMMRKQIESNDAASQKIWDAAKVSFQETKCQKDLVETMKQLNVLDSITQNLRLSIMLNEIFKKRNSC